MANKLVVAVVGYTGGVGTCLLTAMKKIDLKPFALVRTQRKASLRYIFLLYQRLSDFVLSGHESDIDELQ